MPTKCLFLLAAFAIATSASAQQVVSPEVSPDSRVTFRLRAPGAKEVKLRCEGQKETGMEKDEKGVWSASAGPMEPDFYGYSFVVDGLAVTDPRNPLLKYNLLNTESQVHVPGPAAVPWEINDVPRGQLHRHFFKSAIAGDERDFMVYTPPGYDPTARKRYPVLYLLHGFSDDTSAWTSVGQAHVILDNLIARNQARPMVIVMPLGYGTLEILRADGGRRGDLRDRNLEKFQESLFKEVMPLAEKSYRISTDRKERAIAGLSMGGAESLLTGLNNLDRFAWVGAFSSGGLRTDLASQFPALDDKANRQLRLLWIGCGKEDGLLATNKKFDEWLASKGIKHSWEESSGAHSWRVWRRNLAQFVPLLFREEK
jgi:enterochelin esterase family protein